MSGSFRLVPACPACGVGCGEPFARRADGVSLRRCIACGSMYIESVPVDVSGLYNDNYFGLSDEDARSNVATRIGYEASYESSYLDAEFYWAFRLADHLATGLQGPQVGRRCLDVGAATGRLLNVFAAAGYETHGVEFSAPARAIAAHRGHCMTGAPAGAEPAHAGRFDVVTALEVIEHVDDLAGFFRGIHAVMADRGVFVGYFPSSDEVAFARGPEYHWLHHSFEHLVYPSEAGIRKVLEPLFGRSVHVATFLTRQGEDVIPNSVVVAVKGDVGAADQHPAAEIFRQLAYLNDRAAFDLGLPRGPGALAAGWDIAMRPGLEAHLPFVTGVLCAKFGDFEVARHLRRDGVPLGELDGTQLADLLVMAMHDGGVDWMRQHLPVIGPRIAIQTIVAECRAIVERVDATSPTPPEPPRTGSSRIAPTDVRGQYAPPTDGAHP